MPKHLGARELTADERTVLERESTPRQPPSAR